MSSGPHSVSDCVGRAISPSHLNVFHREMLLVRNECVHLIPPVSDKIQERVKISLYFFWNRNRVEDLVSGLKSHVDSCYRNFLVCVHSYLWLRAAFWPLSIDSYYQAFGLKLQSTKSRGSSVESQYRYSPKLCPDCQTRSRYANFPSHVQLQWSESSTQFLTRTSTNWCFAEK